MADIAPLTPLRYDLNRLKGGLANVVAPPYDVIDANERAELAARDPHNVVRLILPEGEGDTKYQAAARILTAWRNDKVLVRDDEPAFYRYDQTFRANLGGETKSIRRRGFLALVKLVALSERIVLPHERTLSGPKEDRLKLFRATETNLSPGFMLYRDPSRTLDAPLESAVPLASFTTADGVEHAVARITSPEALRAIVKGVAASSLLIADGHHRYETALRYMGEASEKHPNSPANAEHRYFMTFLANGDDPNLVVFPTHRYVHALPSFSFDGMLHAAGSLFDVRELDRNVDADKVLAALRDAGARTPTFAAALTDGRVALLSLKPNADLANHPTLSRVHAALRTTDVAILHLAVLEHILGISPEAQAAKTNIFYPQDTHESLRDLRSATPKGQVLFLMNATPVDHVRRVAEAGEVMPQKSTFFYPKVLTGLAIHTLDASRRVASIAD